MSFSNPAHIITRQSMIGHEGHWAKMFDPPKYDPPTPEWVDPTNPVREIMIAAGYATPNLINPVPLHTIDVDLMHDARIDTWDGLKRMVFFMFRFSEVPATGAGTFPAATIRVPRGVIFHAKTNGHGPPPHTIHWHGLEPTPMNDGVGHCSMEIGDYTYQFQPSFIGTYFYHCHRNTVQHFEFGLYGLFLVEPPDAYFASIASTNPDGSVVLNSIPIGACSDGKFRIAANLERFPQFPGYVAGHPIYGVGNATDDGVGDPHAFTAPYDVEALWVFDDRDSVWSDLADDARATFPRYGSIPGVNDDFQRNPGRDGFFAFNDFHADYWYVTGVPLPAPKGGTVAIPKGIVIPPELNSGKSGSQLSVNAQVGQTVLIRCLNGAYNSLRVRFPVDVVIIAWDGRALGVPPYGRYNHAYLLPAGQPMMMSTARRFDCLIRATQPMDTYATAEFINTRSQAPGVSEEIVMTARVPIVITP